jgi:hypothetical protein
MRIAVTSNKGKRGQRETVPGIVRLYTADGTEIRAVYKPGRPGEFGLKPYLEGVRAVELLVFHEVPTELKEFTTIRIGRGMDGISGDQPVLLKGKFTFEGR